jgi:hypothetical protein
MTLTIMIESLTCICTCVVFDFEIFSRASFHARLVPQLIASVELVITEKTTAVEKEKLLADYEDRLASYESQFHAYKT